jgi:hypothetical protein
MNLNRNQRRRLTLALENHGKPYTFARAFLPVWKPYAVFLAFSAAAAVMVWNCNRFMAFSFVGFAAGVVWRDLVYAWLNRAFKPIHDHIIDWEKVKGLLNQHEK